jgi:hypothetical protein
MRLLARVLLGLVAVVVVLAAASYLLPREVPVSRSVVIDAPPAAVFPWVNSLQKTAEWSPWMALDPDLQVSFEGPTEGVGNTMTWVSAKPEVGSGRQEITLSEPDARVQSALDFGGMGTALASFDLAPEGAGTKVTWGLVADMGMSPVGRYMGLMMDRWVGADYEKGLASLKAMVEGS